MRSLVSWVTLTFTAPLVHSLAGGKSRALVYSLTGGMRPLIGSRQVATCYVVPSMSRTQNVGVPLKPIVILVYQLKLFILFFRSEGGSGWVVNTQVDPSHGTWVQALPMQADNIQSLLSALRLLPTSYLEPPSSQHCRSGVLNWRTAVRIRTFWVLQLDLRPQEEKILVK